MFVLFDYAMQTWTKPGNERIYRQGKILIQLDQIESIRTSDMEMEGLPGKTVCRIYLKSGEYYYLLGDINYVLATIKEAGRLARIIPHG